MTEFLLIATLLTLAGGLWMTTMRSRDVARYVVREICQQHNLQLLDQTVALRKIRFGRRSNGNLNLRRQFRFDYSDNGFHRRDGMIWMLGDQPQWISFESDGGRVIEQLMTPASD